MSKRPQKRPLISLQVASDAQKEGKCARGQGNALKSDVGFLPISERFFKKKQTLKKQKPTPLTGLLFTFYSHFTAPFLKKQPCFYSKTLEFPAEFSYLSFKKHTRTPEKTYENNAKSPFLLERILLLTIKISQRNRQINVIMIRKTPLGKQISFSGISNSCYHLFI